MSFLFFDLGKLKKKSGRSIVEICLIEEVKDYNPNILKDQKLFPFTPLGDLSEGCHECYECCECVFCIELMSGLRAEFDLTDAMFKLRLDHLLRLGM
jgi:hypothetical protein